MALLLGSDYTEGISGIGIVNAIEVVNAFPGKDGLREFREWIESPDPTILGKLDVDSNSRRKGPKGGENVKSCSSSNVEPDNAGVKQIFMEKHRNVSKNWHISSSFPSDAVISAYANPQVDKSTEALAWGKPDLFVLRKLCWEKFGWGTSKADELLLPVLNEYNKRETQLRLEAFYTFNERFAKIRSKRIKKAVKDITKNKPSDLMDEMAPQRPVGGKKRKAKSDEANQSDCVGANNDTLENVTVKPIKRSRTKEKTPKKTNLFESVVRKETRARGKQRGIIRKKTSSWEDAEISGSETDEEMQFDKSGESSQVRRSGRVRKTVNYNVSDDESDEKDNLIETPPMDEDPFVTEALGSFNETNNGSNIDEEGTNDWIGGKNDSAKVTQEITRETDKSMSAGLTHGNQTDEQFLKEGSLSEDYLQFGGGFCVDEEDEASNDKEKKIPEESDGLDLGNSLAEEGNREHAEINAGNDDYGLPDETENDDAGSHYAKSLRSMPNLRRKKKKL
ncbi:DNA repair protein UVH3 [Striga asiatica]|uniref:DNA repair protein UVH3 n=1 Tax=Striga asiatica TaxID=4170 RepID=A0A5A7PA94_STRAF|nr:DNA repair protein UVH3 [Striga asiatica]